MTKPCTVRFDDNPVINSLSFHSLDLSFSTQNEITLPEIYSDDAYKSYDIFTAASIGDTESIQVFGYTSEAAFI